ncbi:MAG: hypothetical protein CMO01_11400 [Thalassobius sp.]|nr:hypothetical protein [Thalassovita sp.]
MKKNYFLIVSIFLLIFSIIGFSDNLFFDVQQPSNSDPKFIVHGVFMFAWFIILVMQSNFICKGNYKAHIRWGTAGLIAAVGTVISTFYVFITVYKGWDTMPFYAKANRFLMPSFALYVWLGYKNRKNPALHKRFLFLGTFFLLEPILGRFPLDMLSDKAFYIFEFCVWNMFFLSFFAYDWRCLKKIHRITWMSYLWLYIVYIISILI